MRDTWIFRFFVRLGSLGVFILPFLLGIVLVSSWFSNHFLHPINPTDKTEISFQIQGGETLDTVSKSLVDKGLIQSSLSIKLFSETKKDSNGKPLTLKAGEYTLTKAMSPSEIFVVLSSGKSTSYTVAIPEGVTIKDTAVILARTQLVTKKEAINALKNQRLMTQLGVPAYIPEGYLLSGEFNFIKPVTADKMVTEIVEAGKKKLSTEINNWQAQASALGYRPYEILILASVIFKEAGNDPEIQKKVSSVYHNRLKIGMQLQSENTLRYGLPDLPESLGADDKTIVSPYNTFLNIGLPPTPIDTPSIQAIKAALNPQESELLYFFKKPDGTYIFSSTFKEHQTKLNQEKL